MRKFGNIKLSKPHILVSEENLQSFRSLKVTDLIAHRESPAYSSSLFFNMQPIDSRQYTHDQDLCFYLTLAKKNMWSLLSQRFLYPRSGGDSGAPSLFRASG